MGKIIGASKIARDITVQKAYERELKRITGLYAALSEVGRAIVKMRSRQELFTKICQVLVEFGGFRMAWIGLLDPATQQVLPASQYGDVMNYLQQVSVYGDERPEGQGPAGTAIREGRSYICNDFLHDPQTVLWREAAAYANYRAVAALPIRQEGVVCGAIMAYSDEIDFFQDKEIALLEEVASDVSFALDNLIHEEVRRQAEVKLIQTQNSLTNAQRISKIGNWDLNIQSGELFWSEQLYDLFGIPKTEFGADYNAFLASVHPDDIERMNKAQEDALKGKKKLDIEHRIVLKDGTIKTVHELGDLKLDSNGNPLFLSGITQDVTERKKSEFAIQEYSERLKQLSRKLMHAEEVERRRLGREMHDRIGSNLTALLMIFREIRSKLPLDSITTLESKLDDFESLSMETIQHVRTTLAELRPPALDELGLLAALNHHTQLFMRHSRQQLLVEGIEPKPRLPAEIEISLFRIAQEALNNAMKYSNAERILISLEQNNQQITLTIADNGEGFDTSKTYTPKGKLGMLTMQERAQAIRGHFSLTSVRGEGTKITIDLPKGIYEQ